MKVQKKWMIEESEVTENGSGNKIHSTHERITPPHLHLNRERRVNANRGTLMQNSVWSHSVFLDDLTEAGVKGHLRRVRRQVLK